MAMPASVLLAEGVKSPLAKSGSAAMEQMPKPRRSGEKKAPRRKILRGVPVFNPVC